MDDIEKDEEQVLDPSSEHPELTKKYYKLSEVSDIVKENVSTLRFWEQELNLGSFFCDKRDSGHRTFTPKQIENVLLVKYLIRKKKMTIEGAYAHIRATSMKGDKVERTLTRLMRVRNELKGMIKAYDTVLKYNEEQNKEI